MPLDLNHDRARGPLRWNGAAYQSGHPLLLPAGSVSIPALAIGEADDGFYQVAANDIGLSINGSGVFRWTSTAFLISNILQLTSSALSLTAQVAGAGTTGRSWTQSAGDGSAADAATPGATGGSQTIKSGAGGAGSALQAGGNSGPLVLDVGAAGADGGGGAGSLGGISVGASGAKTTFGGVVLVPSGSASAPGLAFSADEDTGILLEGAGNLILNVAGGRRILVQSSVMRPYSNAGMALGTSAVRYSELWSDGPVAPGAKAVASLPAAASYTGGVMYCTNGDAGSPCLAVSNGTNWLRVALGAAVSAT